jgi:hypothetical protein
MIHNREWEHDPIVAVQRPAAEPDPAEGATSWWPSSWSGHHRASPFVVQPGLRRWRQTSDTTTDVSFEGMGLGLLGGPAEQAEAFIIPAPTV